MIKIKKYDPEDVDELKNDIFNRLEVLKENSDDNETIKKIDNLLDSLEDENNKHQSARRESKKLQED